MTERQNETLEALRRLVYVDVVNVRNDAGDELIELCSGGDMCKPAEYWLSPAGGLRTNLP